MILGLMAPTDRNRTDRDESTTPQDYSKCSRSPSSSICALTTNRQQAIHPPHSAACRRFALSPVLAQGRSASAHTDAKLRWQKDRADIDLACLSEFRVSSRRALNHSPADHRRQGSLRRRQGLVGKRTPSRLCNTASMEALWRLA